MKMQIILLVLLLAIISVVYTHPMPNREQGTKSATNTKMVTDLQKMLEENALSQVDDEVADTQDFGAENLAHESIMLERTADLSQFDDQEADSDKSADESNRFQELALSQEEDDDQLEIASDQDSNLADKDSIFQEHVLSQVDDQNEIAGDQDFNLVNLEDKDGTFQGDAFSQLDGQTEITGDQDFNLEKLADKDSTFQELAFSQVNDQTEIAGDQDFNPENDKKGNKQSDPSGEDDETEIEGDQDFNAENLADKSNTFQQFATFQGDQQAAEDASDESDDLTADEMAIIQQQDFEDALEDAQEQVDSNTAIADDIIALLEGEDITLVKNENAAEQGMSPSIFNEFNSGLRLFVNQMNHMISKYSNVLNCFSKMQAEMERTDENDDELAKEVVDRLANVQGKQNRKIRQLFQKIRQFTRKTGNKGRRLAKNIRRTLGSVLRGYKVVIKCVKRRRG